jgi:hypothetical protein
MSDLCECMAHDTFDTSYIGSDSRMRCRLCNKVLLGWDGITVGTLEDEDMADLLVTTMPEA